MTAKVACSGPRVIPTACTAASTTHNTHVPQAHKAATWKQLLGDASSAPKHLEGQKSPDEMPAPGLSIKLLVAFLPPGPYLPVRQMLPRFLLQGRRFHCALNLSFRFRCPPSYPQSLDRGTPVYRLPPFRLPHLGMPAWSNSRVFWKHRNPFCMLRT